MKKRYVMLTILLGILIFSINVQSDHPAISQDKSYGYRYSFQNIIIDTRGPVKFGRIIRVGLDSQEGKKSYRVYFTYVLGNRQIIMTSDNLLHNSSYPHFPFPRHPYPIYGMPLKFVIIEMVTNNEAQAKTLYYNLQQVSSGSLAAYGEAKFYHLVDKGKAILHRILIGQGYINPNPINPKGGE